MATNIPKARQELTKTRRKLEALEIKLHRLGELELAMEANHAAADISLIIDTFMIREVKHSNGRTVNRKITSEIVRQVLDYYAKHPGITYQEVGEIYRINAGRVSEIVNGQRTVERPGMKGDGLNKAIHKWKGVN